ncbi:MAG: NAD(P)H-binding protein, partial [Lysobacteraceae bacterium]
MNPDGPIVIFGGTGFVGRHLVARLVAAGHDVLVPSRNRSMQRELHIVPQARVINVDVYSDAALRELLQGAHAVINLIGILNERGRNGRGFEAAHTGFTKKLIAACQASGTRRLLQMSALNAGRGRSHYLRTRGEAEAAVKASGLDWTIFQPSVIFGPGDGLFARFAGLLK